MRITANLQITCQGCKEFEEKCRIDTVQNPSQSPGQERPKFGLHSNFRELKRCANGGCALCRRFRQALLLECFSKETISELRGSDSQVFTTMPRCENYGDPDPRYDASFYVEVDIPDRSKFSNKITLRGGYFGARQLNLSPRPDSQPVFAIAEKWVLNCLDNHFCCTTLMRLDDSGRFNPTRLLDLGTRNTSEPRHIEPPEWPIPYCALSYCWGPEPEPEIQSDFITLKNNITKRMQGIPLHLFPQTLQDAMKVVRVLRIRYMWMDALCIIQHDDEDFGQEPAKMHKIYGNAIMTLCLPSSLSLREGFLHHRDAESFSAGSCKLSGSQLVITRKSLRDIRNKTSPMSHCWAFQEELLSPRILYWHNQGLYWSCGKEMHSEFEPNPTNHLSIIFHLCLFRGTTSSRCSFLLVKVGYRRAKTR